VKSVIFDSAHTRAGALPENEGKSQMWDLYSDEESLTSLITLTSLASSRPVLIAHSIASISLVSLRPMTYRHRPNKAEIT